MIWFEWDEAKAKSNRRKHGVRFEDAMLVFADPFAMAEQDRSEDGELRWQTLGIVAGIVLLLVAHTVQNEDTMTKIVKKRLSNSRLATARKDRLKKLAQRPDDDIDTSDMPELTEKFWQNAVRNPFYRPLKQQLTLRLDADVIAWLRRQGRGYQTRANALLRDAMLENLYRNGRKKAARNRPSNSRDKAITPRRRTA